MNKICTTIEQSKKLMELGIDVNTADMFYLRADIALGEIECYPNVLHREDVGDDIPAWSLAALRACLPSGINIDGTLYVFESHNTFDNEWVYGYKYEDNMAIYIKSKNDIDACVEMIIKLYEQNILKN